MELREYETKDQKDIQEYQLIEAYKMYTGVPWDNVLLAETDTNKHCVLAFEEKKLVVFFVLDNGPDKFVYTDNPNALLLRSFSVDQRYGRRGYSKQALQLLPAWLRENLPTCNEVVLGVNETNVIAQRLYSQNGFVDTKERLPREYGVLYVYHLVL